MNSKEYMALVRTFPCVSCGAKPAEIHHMSTVFSGMGKRSSHWLTMPLCKSCHTTDKYCIHNDKTDQEKFLAKTIENVVNYLEREIL